MQGKEFNKLLLSKELWLIFMPFVTVPRLLEVKNEGNYYMFYCCDNMFMSSR